MKLSWVALLLVPSLLFAAEGEGDTSKKPLPPPAVNGPDNINTFLHLQVNNLTQAQPPKVVDRKLILTWKGDVQPRYVAAAFSNEAWRQKHLFWRNQNGVYFLVYDLAADSPSNLDYRLIVDGLWQTDPMNPSRTQNDQGIGMSRISLTAQDRPLHKGPRQGPMGEVEFTYEGKAGQEISVIGNFNQWDPFAHYLDEFEPGHYRLSVTLPTGTILYRFVSGARSFLDPGNLHSGHDDLGGTFSFFENKLVTPPKVLDSKMAMAAPAE